MIRDELDSFGFFAWESAGTDIIRLCGVGMETRTKDYFYDNSVRHDDAYLFQYTLEGRGAVRVDGEERILEKNQAFFLALPSNSSYGLTGDGEGWSFIWIMLSGTAVRDYFNLINGEYGSVFYLSENSYSIYVLRQIYSLARNKGMSEISLSQELSFSFICRLAQGISGFSSKFSLLTINAMKIIENEFSQIRGLSEIAERLDVSQEHLSRTFSRETGCALIDRLTRKRLSHAVSLLRDKKLTIDQIAYECGFSCGNYFTKTFKKVLGISPKNFRNMERNSIYSSMVVLN